MVVIKRKIIRCHKQQRRFCKKFLFSVPQNQVGGKFSLKLYVSILMLPNLPSKCETTLLSSRLLFSFYLLLPPGSPLRVVFLGSPNMCFHLEW